MERLMQYVWQNRLWPSEHMHTVDGQRVTVIDPGWRNDGPGPDFFNAKMRIGDRMWAGNVEIHYRASDWFRHGHDKDRAYDSVILHVVDRDDVPVYRPDGQTIPQMTMPCNPELRKSFDDLTNKADIDLPCASYIGQCSSLHLSDWMSALGMERLQTKTDRVLGLVERFGGDWDQAAFVTISRCLGSSHNNEAFERLACSIPLGLVYRHADSLSDIEAMLLGRAGLLEDPRIEDDRYGEQLRRDYSFLSHKYGWKPLEGLNWRMGGFPSGFPHRRLAMLAVILHGSPRLMSRVLAVTDEQQAREFFVPTLTGYWSRRNSFGAENPRLGDTPGRATSDMVIINAVVPLLAAYGESHADESLIERAVKILGMLPCENNSIVRLFARAGIKMADAFGSQAVIQLRKEYCERRACLTCRFGHRMLARAGVRRTTATT